MRPRTQSVRPPLRAAFSLLEVVLALAILTMGLTACLGLIELGARNAREARDQTRAQEICESVMGLISSNVLDPNGLGGEQPVANVWAQAGLSYGPAGDWELAAEEDLWNCLIESGPTDAPEVLQVTVTITEANSPQPVQFSMVRWMRDPAYLQRLDEEQQQLNQQMSSAAGTGAAGTTGSAKTGGM